MQQIHLRQNSHDAADPTNLAANNNGDAIDGFNNIVVSENMEKSSMLVATENLQQQHIDNHDQENHDENEDEYVVIQPAKIWTRPDIEGKSCLEIDKIVKKLKCIFFFRIQSRCLSWRWRRSFNNWSWRHSYGKQVLSAV